MKVIITREPNFQDNHYCVMEFKGKFETDELPTKSLVHLGSLHKVKKDEYRLEIGVMDLVGKAITLDGGWLYTETIPGGSQNERIIVVKGVVKTKVVFDKRPCPNMDRAEY
jgi:hypothetical protein